MMRVPLGKKEAKKLKAHRRWGAGRVVGCWGWLGLFGLCWGGVGLAWYPLGIAEAAARQEGDKEAQGAAQVGVVHEGGRSGLCGVGWYGGVGVMYPGIDSSGCRVTLLTLPYGLHLPHPLQPMLLLSPLTVPALTHHKHTSTMCRLRIYILSPHISHTHIFQKHKTSRTKEQKPCPPTHPASLCPATSPILPPSGLACQGRASWRTLQTR